MRNGCHVGQIPCMSVLFHFVFQVVTDLGLMDRVRSVTSIFNVALFAVLSYKYSICHLIIKMQPLTSCHLEFRSTL